MTTSNWRGNDIFYLILVQLQVLVWGMDQIRRAGLQQKLDFLDEFIDTLQRDQQAVEYYDPRDIDEAKAFQQMAREDYSRGEFQRAWFEADHAEYLTIFGRAELDKFNLIRVEVLEAIRQ